MRIEPGSSVGLHLLQSRLGIEEIDLRRPAELKQIDDALGFRREVRQSLAPPASERPSSDESAAAPSQRMMRIESNACRILFLRHRLVQIQDQACDRRVGRQFRRCDSFVDRRCRPEPDKPPRPSDG